MPPKKKRKTAVAETPEEVADCWMIGFRKTAKPLRNASPSDLLPKANENPGGRDGRDLPGTPDLSVGPAPILLRARHAGPNTTPAEAIVNQTDWVGRVHIGIRQHRLDGNL